MLRRAFLRRMAFAALATWFLDLPLPQEPKPEIVELRAMLNADGTLTVDAGTRAWIQGGKFYMASA